jgi:enoyl-[acyl-carrier protein] reductase I
MYNFQRDNSPLRKAVTIEDIGGAALYLVSDLSRCVTGEIHYVDGGYNVVAMPRLDTMKAQEEKAARAAAE